MSSARPDVRAVLFLLGTAVVAECIFVPLRQPQEPEKLTSRRPVLFGNVKPAGAIMHQTGSMRANLQMSASDVSYWSAAAAPHGKPPTVSWASRSTAAPNLREDTPVPLVHRLWNRVPLVFKYPNLADDLSTPIWKPSIPHWLKTPAPAQTPKHSAAVPTWKLFLPNLLKPEDVEIFRAGPVWNFDLPAWVKHEEESTPAPLPVWEDESQEAPQNDVDTKDEQAEKWWKPVLEEYLVPWRPVNVTAKEEQTPIPVPGYDSYWGTYDHLAPAYSYATFHDV